MVVYRSDLHVCCRYRYMPCRFSEPRHRRLPLSAINATYRYIFYELGVATVYVVTAGLVRLFLRAGNSRYMYCFCVLCSLRPPGATTADIFADVWAISIHGRSYFDISSFFVRGYLMCS